MEFCFVRGRTFKSKDDQGQLVTIIDDFRLYVIIVDRDTHYKRLFLTKTKHLPIDKVDQVLKKFYPSLIGLQCTVRIDQGGELGKSQQFRDLLKKYDYVYKPTGTNSSK